MIIKTLRSLTKGMLLALTLGSVAEVHANTLKLLTTPFSNGANLGGGEFSAIPVTGTLSTSAYSPFALYLGNIETFCLEYKEHFSPGTVYDFSVSSKAFSGDIAGPGGDPISQGTAWLYSRFATGVLSGYNYDYTNATQIAARKSSSLNLQLALWYLEDETQFISGYGSYDPTTNPFLVAAATQFGNINNAKLDANGAYGVAVLNITSNNGANLHQSQVFLTTPDSATTLSVLGLGLLLLAGLRRQLRR